jgi:hypothetical protein
VLKLQHVHEELLIDFGKQSGNVLAVACKNRLVYQSLPVIKFHNTPQVCYLI